MSMRRDSGRARGHRLSVAVLFLLGICVIGLGASSIAAGSSADPATLMVTYVGSSSLQVSIGNGAAVASGSTIPAGSYQLLVDDPDDTNPNFIMTGPGVNISSNLNSSGMGIDRPAFFGPYVLPTSSTYTLEDGNIGASTAITFTTAATAATTGGSGSSGFSSVSSSGSSASTASGTSTSSSSGSKAVKVLGTLTGSVSAAGKPTLTSGGKTVKSLKAGLYKVMVEDHSKRARLIVEKLGFSAMTLSGTASVGVSSHNLTLSAGKWFFAVSTGGPKTYFSVT
jgi:hypothetical protein